MTRDPYDMYRLAREITDEVLGPGAYAEINGGNPDPGVQHAIATAEVEHVPGTRPVPKMDTPVGLFAGTCSCGWESNGLGSKVRAQKDAEQHARAKSKVVPIHERP